jgi:hypothetical protein
MPSSFKLIGEDTYSVSVGTWANCRGVTSINVRIVMCDETSLNLSTAPTLDLPPGCRDAVFRGVRESWKRLESKPGVTFELLAAYVSPSDESQLMYMIAGAVAVQEWWSLKCSQQHVQETPR